MNPDFDALTDTSTLVPVMYVAFCGTLTDQVAGSVSAEVAVSSVTPTVTVTLTPTSEPVSPPMLNPAVFSVMLMMSSVATALRFNTSAPAGCTVTVKLVLAAL